jgi:diguanylate cyclase (GGDEF)-like protein
MGAGGRRAESVGTFVLIAQAAPGLRDRRSCADEGRVSPDLPAPTAHQPTGVSSGRAGAVPSQARPSSLLAGFEIRAELGRGARSTVYRVRRPGQDGLPGQDHPTEYALKILDETLDDSASALVAFRREAALLASVNHPGLTGVHEVGLAHGRPYLVMDIVEGMSLAERLTGGALPAAQAIALGLDLIDPLAAIHRRGLVHRDLKPPNIMIQTDGTARLIDFGLTAREAGAVDEQTAVGTLAYAAPEQSGMLKRPVDNRSDLYSLGVILFEAISGVLPFSDSDVGELLRMHAVVAAPDLGLLVPQIPPELAVLVAKLLAKDPDDRYQNGEQLAADLRTLPGAPAAGAVVVTDSAPTGVQLTGRDSERAVLAERWAAARSGHGGVCVLRGGGGVGKSALAGELAEQTRAGGHTVLRAQASPDNPIPFAPLRAAIEDHLQAVGRMPVQDRWRRRSAIRGACVGWSTVMLGRLAPSLEVVLNGHEGAPGSAATTIDLDGASDGSGSDGPDSQGQFAAAVAGFLAGLARESGGLLLVLDDVQWLDPGSRRVLAQLSTFLRSTSILVLVTVRDGAQDQIGVEGFAAAMGGRIDVDLTLGPLDETGVAAQIRSLIPGLTVDAELVGLLSVRSNGNPFIVQEYLRAVMDAGLLRPDWGRWVLDEEGLDALELPQDALGLVITRVHGLATGIRELLVTAAAIGARFRPEVVTAVHGISPEETLDALTEAAGRGLIDPREGEFAFLHDRIREALLADLDAAGTADLHRRIAEALDSMPVPDSGPGVDHVYAVAHHYMQCDRGVAADRAFAACWAAGRLALANHAPAEAVVFLEGAAERGTRLPSGFLLLVGTALLRAGKLTQARECLEQALQVETTLLRRAEIFTMVADVYRSNWNTEAALAAIEAGLAELGAPLPRSRVGLLVSTLFVFVVSLVKGWTRIGFGKAQGLRRDHAIAIASLHQIGAYVGVISMRRGLIFTHALRMPYWAHQLGPGRWFVLSQRNLGFVYGNLGLVRAARRAFRRAQADPAGQDPTQAAATAHLRGAAFYFRGHDNGQQWAADTETLGQWLDVATYLDAAATFNLSAVADGRTREAEHWLTQGRRRLGDRTDDVTSFVGAAALTNALLGRSGEAGAELRRMSELCAGHSALNLTVLRLVTTIYVLVEQGELGAPFEEAVREFDALELAPRRLSRGHRTVTYQIALGRLAQLRAAEPADRAQRLAVARRAVAVVAQAATAPELRARALLARADLLVLTDDPRAALAVLEKIDLFQTPDAPLVSYQVARVRARALTALGSGEAHRQARLASSIAIDQRWPHQMASVSAEFGLTAVDRGPQSMQASHAGPHSGLERQRLQALQQVSAAASRVLDPGELARIALDETIRILAADRAFLFLTDPVTGGLVADLGRDAMGQDVPELTGYSTTLVERVRVTGRPLVVTGTEEGAALGAASVVLHGLRSILAAPLQLEGRLLGVVYLDSQVAKGIFTADDAGILTALTNHIATSLETARAAQLEISVQTAQRQRDLADTLRATLQSMSDTFDPEEVVWRLLDSAKRVMACDGVWLLSYDEQAGTVSRVQIDPVTIEVVRTFVEHDTALRTLIEQAKPVIGTTATRPQALAAELADATSWIAVPMRVHDGRTGSLILASNQPHADLGEGLEVAAVLAAQGTTAYDKAVLFMQVQALAVKDEMTGIANRRRFFEVAARDLAAAARHSRPLTVLMVDIDHFKRVNDTYGHATGDDVIRAVATRLAGQIRQTDVIGRYGGEEFALLLQDAGPGSLLPERLRTGICDQPIPTRSGDLTVTVSIGLAFRTDTDTDIEALLSRADKELYRAKEAGRNRVCGG